MGMGVEMESGAGMRVGVEMGTGMRFGSMRFGSEMTSLSITEGICASLLLPLRLIRYRRIRKMATINAIVPIEVLTAMAIVGPLIFVDWLGTAAGLDGDVGLELMVGLGAALEVLADLEGARAGEDGLEEKGRVRRG